MEEDKIVWVAGNSQPLIIPLEKEVMTPQEEIVAEPYYPAEGAVVTVRLNDQYKKYEYVPTVNGNLLTIVDDGNLPRGCFDVEVCIVNPDGSKLRSMWKHQVVITYDNARTLREWDEFKKQDIKARAAVFFFSKGEKGDKGDRGEQGPAGTTDYNELENKPDLSVYLEQVTDEEFDNIFD